MRPELVLVLNISLGLELHDPTLTKLAEVGRWRGDDNECHRGDLVAVWRWFCRGKCRHRQCRGGQEGTDVVRDRQAAVIIISFWLIFIALIAFNSLGD